MSIVETITDDYHFWNWLRKSGSYKDNFSLEGAKAVQEYFEDYSDSIDENVEFDPIAWCVEFTEYDSLGDAWAEHGDEELGDASMIGWFQDRTTVIELDNGRVILGEF